MNDSSSTTKIAPQERTHAKFSPSKLPYLRQCPSFRSMESTNEAAERGTYLHGLMEQVVERLSMALKLKPAVVPSAATEILPGVLANTHDVGDDEHQYLFFCCQQIDRFVAKRPEIYTEVKVYVTHDSGALTSGYLDLLLTFNGVVGVVIDYKFGWELVDPAPINLQGMCYTIGAFQALPKLEKCAVILVQPKLRVVTEKIWNRTDIPEMLNTIREVIRSAEEEKIENPGPYCSYCSKAGGCASLTKTRATVSKAVLRVPAIPDDLKDVEGPERLALIRYWIELAETRLDDFKAQALKAAEDNGGRISCTLPSGQEIVYEVKYRNVPRVLGKAPDVAEAIKDVLTKDEILEAADLSLGALSEACARTLVDRAKANKQKLTKKAATEEIEGRLTALGLLSTPDTKVKFLKLQKAALKQVETTTTQNP